MASLWCLCSCSLTRRFSLLPNARLISCVALRSREYPVSDGQHLPLKPKSSAMLYCIEKHREHAHSAGSDGGAFSFVECMKEWKTLTDSEKKPYIDQQRLQSQEYKEYKKSLSKEERAEIVAKWREHLVKLRKHKEALSQWRRIKQENAGAPRKISGTTLFAKEKLPDAYIDHGNPKGAFRAVAVQWNDLDVDTKMRYKELARVQYENDVKEYQKIHPDFLVEDVVPRKLNGYNVFIKERLQSIMHRDSVTPREAMKTVTKEWAALSDGEKMEYRGRANAVYTEAVSEFLKTNPTFVPTGRKRPRKKRGYSFFVKEALQSDPEASQSDPDANTEEVFKDQWNQLSSRKKWYYNALAENQYYRRRNKYLKATGLHS